MTPGTITTLLRTARQELPPDTVITNGRIVNVFTNEIEEGKSVTIKDGYIVSVDERTPPGGVVIDAQGAYLCPGFLDCHTHLDAMYSFHELVPYSLKGGTTTVITECGMVANACGMDGVLSFIESTRGYPLRCYFLAPPLTPPFPDMEGSKGITLGQFKRLLKRDDFLGIGEAYWMRLVTGDERLLEQAALALSLGKTLEGHSSGARGPQLNQYVLTGITSCHESVTPKEAIDKLRYGVYVMIREGFVRRELPELHRLKDAGVDTRRLILVSDVFDATMLVSEGYLDAIVRTAISYGFTPIEAVKMATVNAADYYGLRHLGAIAPMRYADILFLDDLEKVSISKVMANGEIVVDKGRYKGKTPRYDYGEKMRKTVTAGPFGEIDFRITAPAGVKEVRLIEVVNETITREARLRIEAGGGYVGPDPSKDIALVTVINRNRGKGLSCGLIKGTGISDGAIATTAIWDTCNILCVGSSERDVAAAVNRLIEIQGGYVIVKKGRPIFELPMPVYGLVSEAPMEQLAGRIKELARIIKKIGSPLANPFLAIQTISFTGLPFLRITDKGLVDIKSRQLVSLFVD